MLSCVSCYPRRHAARQRRLPVFQELLLWLLITLSVLLSFEACVFISCVLFFDKTGPQNVTKFVSLFGKKLILELISEAVAWSKAPRSNAQKKTHLFGIHFEQWLGARPRSLFLVEVVLQNPSSTLPTESSVNNTQTHS